MGDLFNDNVRVRSTKYGAEFLKIAFNEPDKDSNYDLYVCRYFVPGRYDRYCFKHLPGGMGFSPLVGCSSERDTPITKLLPMLRRDMDKPQVVDLVKDACSSFRNARKLAG